MKRRKSSPPADARPPLNSIRTGADLRQWYWRKDELAAFARQIGVSANANKFALIERIAHFLDTGDKAGPEPQKAKPVSKFDWHGAALTPETVITDNYRNTQNVRRFFRAQLGDGFKFNIAFMEWMRANAGKSLADACTAFSDIESLQNAAGHRTSIKEHNQFNQYTRDFLDDNLDLGMDDVRRIWARKIQLPSSTGRHRYHRSDLKLP